MRVPAVIHLIRHGESRWNAARRVQGQTMDVALTALGIDQAHAAAAALAAIAPRPIDELWTSDLLRARQTAEIIGARVERRPQLRRELREQGLGILEGQPVADALRLAAGVDWTDPDDRVRGGESLREVYRRLKRLFEPLRAAGDVRVGVVTHGDTIRVALALLSGQPVADVGHQGVANGSITTVEFGG